MKSDRKKRARYGSGSLWLRHRIWWVKWREVRRHPDGRVEYVQHAESTGSEDRGFAQRVLRGRLQAAGGRRPTVVDPEKVSYEDVRDNFLDHCVAKGLRSIKRDQEGKPTLATLPRLDKFFGSWKANEITVADLKRFRSDAREDGLSDARANRYMATLRAMFNQARKDELITRAEVPAYFPTVAEPNEARGAIFIKPEWYAPLRKALKEPLRSAFTLAYHTGVQRGSDGRRHRPRRLCLHPYQRRRRMDRDT